MKQKEREREGENCMHEEMKKRGKERKGEREQEGGDRDDRCENRKGYI